MKRTLILVIFALLVVSSSGQKSYLGINLGTSIPGSQYGEDSDLLGSGYAVSGFSIEFDGIYFPGSVFGIGGMIGFGSFYTQQDKYFENLRDYLNNHPDLAGFTLPGRNDVSFSSGFWNHVNFMVGPELSAPIWRFQLGVRVMGGASVIISPKRELNYESTLENVMVKTNGTDLSLSYLYGASLMYFLSPGTSLRLTADSFYSRADYNFDADVDTPVGTISESSKERIDINTIQLSIGLSYAF